MHGMYDYAILRDLATARGGLSLTMEHRFYGESLPFGNHSRDRSSSRFGLLSVEQDSLPSTPPQSVSPTFTPHATTLLMG